jgi:nicotinamidase-related amidase
MAKASEFEEHCWKDIIGDDLMQLYQGYQRETAVGKNAALLLVDLYKLVYLGGNKPVSELYKTYPLSCGEFAWNGVEPTKALIASARAANVPIIYLTRHLDTKGIVSVKRGVPLKLPPDAYEIFPDFAPRSEDLVVYKERASGFFGTPLVAHLQMMGIKSLVIGGESTSGCVRHTVLDAYAHGFQVTIAEECTFDRNPLLHKVNLFDMHHKYADVMHTDEIIDHFGKLANQSRSAA